jgi:hypothetical protein
MSRNSFRILRTSYWRKICLTVHHVDVQWIKISDSIDFMGNWQKDPACIESETVYCLLSLEDNYGYVCPQCEIHYRQAYHGHTVSSLPLIKSETNMWGVSHCRVEFIRWGGAGHVGQPVRPSVHLLSHILQPAQPYFLSLTLPSCPPLHLLIHLHTHSPIHPNTPHPPN